MCLPVAGRVMECKQKRARISVLVLTKSTTDEHGERNR